MSSRKKLSRKKAGMQKNKQDEEGFFNLSELKNILINTDPYSNKPSNKASVASVGSLASLGSVASVKKKRTRNTRKRSRRYSRSPSSSYSSSHSSPRSRKK